MLTKKTIACPICKSEIDIQNVLLQDIEKESQTRMFLLEKKEKEFEEKRQNENALFKEREDKIRKQIQDDADKKNEADRKRIEQQEQEKMNAQLKKQEDESAKLRQELSKMLETMTVLQNQIANNDIEKQKAEIALRSSITQEVKAQTTQQAKLELEQKFLRELEEKDMKIKEAEMKLEQQEKSIHTMQRNIAQGSMQLQGEVQELLLEEFLKTTFPFDLIEEVGKGVKGADVLQRIFNAQQQECGTIIYESKRTQNFSHDWVDKLKNDQTQQEAVLAILVTQTMPKDMPQFGLRDGVWICTFNELKTFIKFIRESIIKEYKVKIQNENIDDKKQRLYNYLVSGKFSLRVENIVKGFVTLKEDLESEKRIVQKNWKKREEQIEFVLQNTIEMHGSLQGIGGNVMPKIPLLEEPEID